MGTEIRINKLLSDHGLCSRREADQWIAQGLIKKNGKTVYELGAKVDPEVDRITVSGKPLDIKSEQKFIYLMANKPKGMLTTTNDPYDRPTVMDLVPKIKARLFPVGRLDWDSEGLILLTNHGEFANRVTHPSHAIEKTYLVKVEGEVTDLKRQKLLRGVAIEGGKVRAKRLEPIDRPSKGKSTKHSWFKVVITDGKNRQIRKMFEKINCDVIKLQRVAIGQLTLGTLRRGQVKALTLSEIEKIFTVPKTILSSPTKRGPKTDLRSARPSRKRS